MARLRLPVLSAAAQRTVARAAAQIEREPLLVTAGSAARPAGPCPGERFSLNRAIGPRTAARGFVTAPVIHRVSSARTWAVASARSPRPSSTRCCSAATRSSATTAQLLQQTLPDGSGGDRLPARSRPGGRQRHPRRDPHPHRRHRHRNHGELLRRPGRPPGVGRRAAHPGHPAARWDHRVRRGPKLPRGTQLVEPAFTGCDVEVVRVITQPGRPTRRERFFTRYRSANPKVIRGTAAG
jgi:hypothetical protein